MAFLDHEGGAEFPYTRDTVFDAIAKAIRAVPSLKVYSSDKLGGRILVKAGVSLMSWGENIPISIVELVPGRTRVSIISTPKTGLLFGGALDLGKNRKNIEKVLDELSRVLSQIQPVTQQSSEIDNVESTIDQLKKLADLRAQGVLTDVEFQDQKSRLLDSGRRSS